ALMAPGLALVVARRVEVAEYRQAGGLVRGIDRLEEALIDGAASDLRAALGGEVTAFPRVFGGAGG
ncbi:MAG: hypothetical protein MI920_00665, partial [Kiloniellales bacterium]|nr:hypothetical protein [Kiloniellales bacterium]